MQGACVRVPCHCYDTKTYFYCTFCDSNPQTSARLLCHSTLQFHRKQPLTVPVFTGGSRDTRLADATTISLAAPAKYLKLTMCMSPF